MTRTRQRSAGWGQAPLLTVDSDPPTRFRVKTDTAWGPVTSSLPLAIAHARAAALDGQSALICADDGTAAVVRHGPGGFEIAALDDTAGWPVTVQRVLARHG